ncbi:L,D-transpeptidase family protein [Streptomyces sp. MBT65]|uniref:L,D-transpeptidase family protein n=1 Tax=Streptomyces sp. MBT65 TaxID=1488395 RepID=UPI00190DE642|nr:L,D-transpeptidase family protein [Streptomyces sp. MBT65]MBK3576946.1 L,D-transpeptidase family protein [Streptomyces sp. MBT65]
MRPGVVALASASLLLLLCAVPARAAEPSPLSLADTGGGGQLILAQAQGVKSTSGTLSWWERRGGRWVKAGSTVARFGAKGLVEGRARKQGSNTTPTGLHDLPYAFGIKAAPGGTHVKYRRVNGSSWWCEDTRSRVYNRWSEPLASDCRASESERLISYTAQYAYGVVIGFNYAKPVKGRGAGIFLHVNGRGATAGCVSVSVDAMRRILRWADPGRAPHIAIGTVSGVTAITRY